MIKNYIKTAWRNLVKNKAYTFINLTGLAVGLTCSLFILLWVKSELSVDAYHKNGDRLYQVYEREYYDHKIDGNYDTPALMAAELKKTLPEVEYAAAMDDGIDHRTFRVGNKILKIEGTYASADLFKMFSYPLIYGSATSALGSPLSIAISEKMAGMFFGNAAAAIGKTIRFENKKDLTVSAVYKDLPENSSNKFEFVINWQEFLLEHPGFKRWDNTGPLTYVQLRPDANVPLVNKKLRHFLNGYTPDKKGSYHAENALQRYDKVYLHAHFENGEISGGRIDYVRLFSIVAVFILLIACINFMNLTTAQSVKRAREIGVRKVMGAVRGVLIRQFMSESFMFTLFSIALSLLLTFILLPVFNQITQKNIVIPFNDISFWTAISAITVITGLVSGSYPALFLSSFSPVKVLKGTVKLNSGWLRKGLVIFQFVLSSVLIIATFIVSKQVSFIQNRNIGYDRKNLVYIPVEGDLGAKYEIFKNKALNIPGIKAVSIIGASPTFIDNSTISISWDGKDPNSTVAFSHIRVGYDFITTMKLKMLNGRDFSRAYTTDSVNYIINEVALHKIGYANPIGMSFTMWGVKGKIIGLIKDFHYRSIHEPIQPLVIVLNTKLEHGNILVRIQAEDTKKALSELETICRQLNPNFPFNYHFSDEQYQQLYKNEQIVGKISNIFAFLAIFISCLGLTGLAIFTAEQRVKEMAVRKVMGASVRSLFTLLSYEFLVLVIISILIATPVAWYSMNKWLQGFAYHTSITWWMFAMSGGLIIGITLATVSFEAVKAALLNPVKGLRSE